MNLQFASAFGIGRLDRGQPLCQDGQARFGHVDREPGPQTRGEIKSVIVRLRQIVQTFGIGKRGAELRMHSERKPDIGRDQRAHSTESIRRDTDDRVRLAVDQEITSDEIGAAAHFFPKRIAYHHHRYICVRPALFRVVESPGHGLHTHKRKEIFRR